MSGGGATDTGGARLVGGGGEITAENKKREKVFKAASDPYFHESEGKKSAWHKVTHTEYSFKTESQSKLSTLYY